MYATAYASIFVAIFWFTVYLSHEKRKPGAKSFPSMTLIVPAHNEEKTIVKCLKSLVGQNYPGLKILVVDDGSTDNTANVVKTFAQENPSVRYYFKKHAGKASALNYGLRRVNTELCGFIDSDTYLSKTALGNMIGYFHDNVASVTVCIKPASTKNLVQKLQRMEYMIASFTRKLMSYINSVYYTPGFAIYKTSVLKKLGGFDEHTLTEDLEIGLRLKNNGYDIENTIEDYAYTEVPKTFGELFHQRMRWYRGFISNTRKYKHMFFNRNFGDLGILVLPIQYILLALVTPFMLYGLYSGALLLADRIIDISLVGFDVNYFMTTGSLLNVTPATFFFLMLLGSFFFMLWLSQKNTEEKIGKATYVTYIILYPFINTFLWISALIYEIANAKKKW
jgi:cellulose synthase/poly-beta-1,6-N-acetylglucosamine synthase-like glycosyltransferase